MMQTIYLYVTITASAAGATGFFPNGSTQSTFTTQTGQARMSAPVPVSAKTSIIRQFPVQTEQTVETDASGGAKRVFRFRQHFEKETVNPSQPEVVNRVERVASPPPPPLQFADQTPRMAPAPPAPPPPPPLPNFKAEDFDHDKGTFTFRDRKGRARTVRIGRVVWPPPPEKEEKKHREVGRLEIDENVQRELDEKMRPKNPVKKVESFKKEEKKVSYFKKKIIFSTFIWSVLYVVP